MSDKLKDKLNQTDKDNVVQNTATNEAVKQTAKMKPQEQLAIAEPAVKEELQVAQEKGEIDQKQAAQVYNNLAENKNKGDSLTKQFTGALKFLMPQMVGAAVGGLAGGDSRSALGGAELAGQAAKGYRDEIREEKKLQLQADRTNQLMNYRNRLQQTQVVHEDTGVPLQLNPQSGEYIDPEGNVVPPAKLRNLRLERENRLVRSTDDRIARGNRRENRLGKQFEFRKEKDIRDFGEKQELSDKQLEQLGQYDMALQGVDRIKEILPADALTGPIQGRINAAKQFIGASSDQYDILRAEYIDNVAQYIRSISGAQASDNERRFLEDAFPKATDSPKVFVNKLDQLEKRLEQRRGGFIENVRKYQGKLQDVDTKRTSTSSAQRTGQGESRRDQALRWLKNNPEDPRAEAIRKKLGL